MNIDRKCRHCAAPLTLSLADLGVTPVANDYVSEEDFFKAEPFYSLHVFVCSDCRLAQIDDILQSDELFREDYAYFSSVSSSWLEHARTYVSRMIERFGLDEQSTFVEVASNDGYLLQYVKKAGIRAVGIEPCQSVADVAIEKGIETQVAFFGEEAAQKLKDKGVRADAMAANNVLAHVPDINDFVKGFKILLAEQGVATFEQQHLLQLMQQKQFDTIYHEHYSYLSLLAAQRLFAAAGLRVFDVEHLSSHGGSLRLFVCHNSASHKETDAVVATLREEKDYGLDEDAVYESWARDVREAKRNFLSMLVDLKREGASIAAYGAPAKGNTLLNYCGIGLDFIDFTVDRAESKQGKYLPGSRLPILHPDEIMSAKPDYIVILPWNLKDEIMSQMAGVRAWGGKFIVPIPEPEIL
ncbi:MAG: class I SAM-dependent methyltransferase [Alphaproteobacteria bacterium]|nr:class I SAM-dependent methyltransferase [Alphaproteobacteria bacterium]